MKKSAEDGNILPPLFKNLSLAITNVSIILSLSKNVPSGSLIIVSTFSGKVTSSIVD
jgi:hypothetical protein